MLSAVNVLLYGKTDTYPALRHELPLVIVDPFLYLEADGCRAAMTSALEEERIAQAAPDVECLLVDALGWEELRDAGLTPDQIERELCLRAVSALAIGHAVVPGDFPLGIADHLRAAGIELHVDEQLFSERRRHKTAAELAGIRRAADAAVRAMAEAARMLREASIDGATLRLDGETLTAETVRTAIRELCARAGAPAPANIMVLAAGPDGAIGHEIGHGPLPAHEPIEVDLWPCDESSGCWADMTRTFVRGTVSERVAEIHRLTLDAFTAACAAVRPGVTGAELHGLACEVFEAAGHPTQRMKKPGETLREGFYFGLGHGVGLEVHEPPLLGRTDRERLVAGDVIAVEPGTFRPGVGGTRVEDLLIVTDSGYENLTGAFAHELVP